jgi:hypothetical protein
LTATRRLHIKVPEDVVGIIDGEARKVYLNSRPEQKGCVLPRWVIIKRALEFYVSPFGSGKP